MTYVETVSEATAEGPVAAMYAQATEQFGYLPNLARAMSLRPEVYGAWTKLNGAIKASMDLGRYELATVAAARRLGSSYCMLAHGQILADQLVGPEQTRAIALDHHNAGLDGRDVAIMDFADKVARRAGEITEHDINRLRALGLADDEILSVVLAAAARCFFSTVLDAVGALPDAKFSSLEPELRDALVVGRPIEGTD